MTIRTVTGNIIDITGSDIPEATFSLIPESFVFGSDPSAVVFGDLKTVVADGNGDVSFEIHEGKYLGRISTSQGSKTFRLVVDSDGPWTLGRLIGELQGITPSIAAQIFEALGDAETARDLSESWATGTEPGGAGTKSSREWAEDAEGFRDQAGASATSASLSGQQAQAAAVLAGAPIAPAFPTDDTETAALPSPFLFIAPEGVQSWTHGGTFASLVQGPYVSRVLTDTDSAAAYIPMQIRGVTGGPRSDVFQDLTAHKGKFYAMDRERRTIWIFDADQQKGFVACGQVGLDGDKNLESIACLSLEIDGRIRDFAFIGRNLAIDCVDVTNAKSPRFVGTLSVSPGQSRRLDFSGHYLFSADSRGDKVDVIDVSDPENMNVVATLSGGGTGTADLWAIRAHRGLILTGTTGGAFGCWDISDPENPVFRSRLSAGDFTGSNNFRGIWVKGKHAYITSFGATGRLVVIDISDPDDVALVSETTLAAPSRGIVISGDVAYVLQGGAVDEVHLYDISDPAAPAFISAVDGLGAGLVSIWISGDRLAVAGDGGGANVSLLDISVPDKPAFIGSFRLPNCDWFRGVAVSSNYAYLNSGGANAFKVFDLTAPDRPYQIGEVIDPALERARDVVVRGSHAFIASRDAGAFVVVDVSRPDAPSIAGSVSASSLDGARGCAVSGDYAYVSVASFNANSGRIVVIDISDPTDPTVVQVTSEDVDNGGELSLGSLIKVGSVIYATGYGTSGTAPFVSVFNAADPANIQWVRNVDVDLSPTIFSCRGLTEQDGYLFVSGLGDESDGGALIVLDARNEPTDPQVVGFVRDPILAGARSCAVQGDYCYVAARIAHAVVAVDISEPNNPKIVDHVSAMREALNQAYDVTIANNRVYCSSSESTCLTVIG